ILGQVLYCGSPWSLPPNNNPVQTHCTLQSSAAISALLHVYSTHNPTHTHTHAHTHTHTPPPRALAGYYQREVARYCVSPPIREAVLTVGGSTMEAHTST